MTLTKLTTENSVNYVSKDEHSHCKKASPISKGRKKSGSIDKKLPQNNEKKLWEKDIEQLNE